MYDIFGDFVFNDIMIRYDSFGLLNFSGRPKEFVHVSHHFLCQWSHFISVRDDEEGRVKFANGKEIRAFIFAGP